MSLLFHNSQSDRQSTLRRRPCRYCSFLLFLSLFLLLLTEKSWSAEIRLAPLVILKQEYNDNLFSTEDNAKGDFISTIGGGLHFSRRTERNDLDLKGHADQLLYKRYTGFNEMEFFLDGRFSQEITPLANLFTKASYKRESNTNRDFEETGIVESPETSKRQNYSIGGDYELTDLTTATLTYGYGRNDYDDPLDYDSRIHTLSLAFSHYLSQTMSGRLNLGYVTYNLTNSPLLNGIVYDTDSTVDNYTTSLGGYYMFNEKFSILCDVGMRYTDANTKEKYSVSTFPLYKNEEDSSDTAWIGNLAINYQGETTNAGLTGYRDVSSGGGNYGVTERTSFIFQVGRRFTYELSGNVSCSYYRNKRGSAGSDPQGLNPPNQDVDEKTYSFSPSLTYRFTNDLSVVGRWRYSEQKDDADNTTTNRNLWMVQLTYEFPIIE